jgi:uncharacterized protein (UPF0332 family)
MNEEVAIHFESADKCIAQAELLYAASHPGAAIGRSYYAMFHAATAALLHKGVERHSHRGILAAFAQTFVKTGRTDARFHRYLREAFDLRQESDYQPAIQLTIERAQEVLGWAREFVAACKKLCE